MCCSFAVEKVAVTGSAKGAKGWREIDTARVYFDDPYHARLDQTLNIDFVSEATGGIDRVAIELSPDSARALVQKILTALANGEAGNTPVAMAAE